MGRMTQRRCRWIPFYRRLADTRCRFLFRTSGGVCNTPLPYQSIEATSIHSPPLENISRANDPKALPSETILGAADPKAPSRVGAYCIRPTQCPGRRNSIQERLPATRRRFLFGSFEGVCFCALPYRPTGATSIHSLPLETNL